MKKPPIAPDPVWSYPIKPLKVSGDVRRRFYQMGYDEAKSEIKSDIASVISMLNGGQKIEHIINYIKEYLQ